MDVAAFLLALVPIIWLVVMLLCFKWPAWKAAIGSFVLSCLLAFAWWHRRQCRSRPPRSKVF